jgi:predicted transcriptional regulator
MGTTTIRLPDDLKAQVERVAAARGASAHAFMLEAIAEVAQRLERQQDFEAEAERRWKRMLRTGEYLTLDDLRAYAQALARGQQPAKPKLRKMTPEELARLRASARRAG